MSEERARRSLALLEERVAAIEGVLAELLASWPERRERLAPLGEAERVWVTGAGASEGPARLLAALADRPERPCRFVPLSTFCLTPEPGPTGGPEPDPTGGPEPGPAGGALVLISQGLCPNARLALEHRRRFDPVVLITALTPEADAAPTEPRRLAHELAREGGIVLTHPPASEGSILVRVIGPAAASVLALLLAEQLAPAGPARGAEQGLAPAIAGIDEARRRARGIASIERPATFALVVAADYDRQVHGLRWKLLESLPLGDPPVWDVLQIPHGPFQQLYRGSAQLLALETPSSGHLFDRLEDMLVPERHRLIRLTSRFEPPLSWLEHDAQLNELVLEWLRRAPVDLIEWPGKGRDGALYRLGQ